MSREEMLSKLDSKIPRSVIRKREGSGGKTFDYLEGHYVIARMNEIFGQGNWAYMTEEIRHVHSGEVQGKYGVSYTSHYIAKVRVEVPALGHAIFSDVGYGDGSDKQNPGKAHELAAKEAVTDALKRACKNLGMSMGLALYDKDQENVDEEEVVEKVEAKPVAAKPAAKPAKQPEPAKEVPVAADGEKSKQQQLDLVKATYKVVLAKAGANKEKVAAELKAHLKSEYGADKSDQLTEEQLSAFLAVLKSNLNKGE